MLLNIITNQLFSFLLSSDVIAPASLLGGPPPSLMLIPGTSSLSRIPGQPPLPLNPAMNDAPLEFNKNKGKPPMPVMGVGESNLVWGCF